MTNPQYKDRALLAQIIGHSSFSVCQGAFLQALQRPGIHQHLGGHLKGVRGYQMEVVGHQIGVAEGYLDRQN